MADKNVILFGVGLGLVLVVAVTWAARRALPAFNPFNVNNVIADNVNGVVEAVTGDPSLGGWLCDLNPFSDCAAANRAIRAPVILDQPGAADPFLGAP